MMRPLLSFFSVMVLFTACGDGSHGTDHTHAEVKTFKEFAGVWQQYRVKPQGDNQYWRISEDGQIELLSYGTSTGWSYEEKAMRLKRTPQGKIEIVMEEAEGGENTHWYISLLPEEVALVEIITKNGMASFEMDRLGTTKGRRAFEEGKAAALNRAAKEKPDPTDPVTKPGCCGK